VSLFICTACGTQYPESPEPPATCPLCADDRQFVPASGQQWTTREALTRGHRNAFQRLEPDLFGIGTEPRFAIGQRALLLRTPDGNVLWDCISLLDDATIEIVRALGGIRTIAISHPHYYTTMADWSRAFDAPVLLHARDRRWATRSGSTVVFWEDDTREVVPGVRLVRCGGHFAGGTVLLWDAGADGRGALLSGDILQVVADTRFVSIMRSYPNYIPLSAADVQRIGAIVARLRFDRIYGAFWDHHVERDARQAVADSVRRYVRWVTAPADAD
jgi:hypothetical protein